MSVQDMTAELEALSTSAETAFATATTRDVVESLRVEFLGKKGKLTAVLRSMGKLSAEERPKAGKVANVVRDQINALVDAGLTRVENAALEKELSASIDVTLPGRQHRRGSAHPITQTSEDILDVLASLGFERAEGPEIEHDFYNFEALNMPADHPARDMQDTFYVDDKVVLRTHTSGTQVRTMLAQSRPPVRIAAFGRVYRNDPMDPTHSPMFHQIEGLFVDEKVTFGDLKGTLQVFIDRIFAPGTGMRLRPSFFPFTEPSAEVDIQCFSCGGSGKPKADSGGEHCRICKGTGWVEIMGAGMVDPAVFEASGLDPDAVTGFAFGIGVERVAMLRYGIEDIRTLFDNDQRFLRQFF